MLTPRLTTHIRLQAPAPAAQRQVSIQDCIQLNKRMYSAGSYDELTAIIFQHHSDLRQTLNLQTNRLD